MKHSIFQRFTQHPVITVGIVLPAIMVATSLQFPEIAQNPFMRSLQVIPCAEAAALPSTSPTASAASAKQVVAPAQSMTPVKKTPSVKTADTNHKKIPPKVTKSPVPKKVLHPSQKPAAQAAPSLTLPKPASMQSLTKPEMALLISAREAYWKRDAPKSIADYKKLLQKVPNHPGIYGEMGNVYYMTGQYAPAGKAYAAAAREMIHLHLYAEAYGLLPLIGSLNPHEASAIAHSLAMQRNAAAAKMRHREQKPRQ